MVLSVFRKTQRNRRLSPDDDSDVVDNPLGFVLKKKKNTELFRVGCFYPKWSSFGL